MNYKLTTPCDSCPFRRGTSMKLRKGRIKEIAGMMLNSQGGSFPCHKTVNYGTDDEDGPDIFEGTQHCAGALIFALKHNTLPQLSRIAERIGMLDCEALLKKEAMVFSSTTEMIKAIADK